MAAVARRAVGVYGRAEVATVEELELATTGPVTAPAVFIGGIAKSSATLRRAAAVGATIKIDSEAELERLRRVALLHDGDWSVLLRIALPRPTAGHGSGCCPTTRSGSPPRGSRGRDASAACTSMRAPASPIRRPSSTPRSGAHRCSRRSHDSTTSSERASTSAAAIRVCPTTTSNRRPRAISVQSPMRWPSRCDPDSVEFVCEPGRITVERAGVLVATVVERAPRATRCAVVIDAGSTLAGGSWAPVRSGRAVVHCEASAGQATICDVYGNLCHEGDLVAEGARRIPPGVRRRPRSSATSVRTGSRPQRPGCSNSRPSTTCVTGSCPKFVPHCRSSASRDVSASRCARRNWAAYARASASRITSGFAARSGDRRSR